MARAYVGTSGWCYQDWRSVFYPAGLSESRFLEFYSRHFTAVELNFSFYRLPTEKAISHWCEQVPSGFVFAVKLSRFISHLRFLKGVDEAWKTFVDRISPLNQHRGPVLVQLPEKYKVDTGRLAEFLALSRDALPSHSRLRLVFEFRHESWFCPEVLNLLSRYESALCIADSPCYPRKDLLTADFTYYRFHGRTNLFASRYRSDEMRAEALNMKRLLKDGIDVYAFFNNDAEANAVANAIMLSDELDEWIRPWEQKRPATIFHA